jgi:hypothetical protein
VGLLSAAFAVLILGGVLYFRRLNRRFREREDELLRGEIDDLPEFTHHMFLSYRRVDFVVADGVASFCREAGLRVFKDREGSMTGEPFDLCLLNALRASALFCPLISVAALEKLIEKAAAKAIDFTLVEYVLALHYKLAGRLRGVLPLLLGPEVLVGERQVAMWSHLPEDATFNALRAAIPDVVPFAALEAASALLRAREPGAELAPSLRQATLREIMGFAAGQGAQRGIMLHDWHSLEGRPEGLRAQALAFAVVVRDVASRKESPAQVEEQAGGYEPLEEAALLGGGKADFL